MKCCKNQRNKGMKKNERRKGDHVFSPVCKLLLAFILISGVGVLSSNADESHAQETRLTFSVKNATVKSVLDRIEKSTGFSFMYENNVMDLNSKVDFEAENESIESVLDRLLSDEVAYRIVGKHILLFRNEKQPAEKVSAVVDVQQQQRTVTGKVTDQNGEPLPGTTVMVKGTAQGTITDADGNYSLSNVPDDATLVFSFVGMETQEINVGNRTRIDVTLQEEAVALEEVVAVGYGTMRKSDLTGSISQVQGEKLKNIAARSAADALQGKTAGVMVTSTSGSPGSLGAVRIRGVGTVNDNNPLYVVDGLPQTDIGWLSTNDIESMEVLKDASATAIYGARAANGVIIISTKNGNKAEKYTSTVTFDTYIGFQNPAKRYYMLDAEGFMRYKNMAYSAAGQPLLSDFETPEKREQILQFIEKNTGSRKGTDWWKEATNKDAPIQNYNIAVAGGINKVNYYSSLGYMGHTGFFKGSDYERISWRNNVNSEVTKWLNLSYNSALIYENRHNISENNPWGTMFSSIVADPISPVYRDNLVDIPSFLEPKLMTGYEPTNPFSKFAPIIYSNKQNPVAEAYIMDQNIWEGYSFKNGLIMDVQFTPFLKFRSNFGLDLHRGISKGFTPKYYLDAEQFSSDAIVSRFYYNTNHWVWDNTITFEKTFGVHHLLAMIGTSAEQNQYEQTGASKEGLINNDKDQRIINAAAKNPAASGYDATSSINSYFGRLFYNFHNRYLLTVNIRRDGSSNFAKGKKWGTFPSFSAGWIFSEENFMRKYDWLSMGKLRLGAGKIGNQNIGGGAYLSIYGNTGYYTFGNPKAPHLGGGLRSIGNPDIRWETTNQTDIGLDLGFLNDKFTFTADYFKKTTKGMLLQVPLPTTLGYPNTPWENAGSVENKGFEFELGYKEKIRNVNFSLEANLFTFKNKVISLGGGEPINVSTHLGNMTHTRTEEGFPIGYFYGWKTDGIFQNQEEINAYVNNKGELIQPTALPGDIKFSDLNGYDEEGNIIPGPDGKLNDADKVMIGNPFPDFTFGLTMGAEYKGFDLSMFFQGSVGNDILYILKYDIWSGAGWYNAPKDIFEVAWHGPGTSNTQFAINANSRQNLQMSDWYVEDGSYVRLKNIQLGYTIPKTVLKNKYDIRVWIGGQNLFTWTKYPGLDPEVGSSDPKLMGIDAGFYPQARIFMMGINATF